MKIYKFKVFDNLDKIYFIAEVYNKSVYMEVYQGKNEGKGTVIPKWLFLKFIENGRLEIRKEINYVN